MGLEDYRRKRRFGKTPEPKPVPGAARGANRFVVHKHQASHLHYDLRLEHRGVLKSWAVPKGPSMDPGDKRLAIQVDDHPLAYKDFAGRIPEGEYGAGLVEIWDKGTFVVDGAASGREEAEKRMAAALKKGHLDFIFQGRKLQGLFTLVRIKSREGDKDNQWLLMKRKDAPAAAVAATPSARTYSLESADLKGAAKRPFPNDVEPMLATLIDGPFDRDGWAFEVKWDGYRSLAKLKGGKVRLVSRNGKNQNSKFPAVAAALDGFPLTAVFDGEIVVVDEKGRPDFQALQNARGLGEGRVLYYVFDVLYAGGYDLRKLPLRRRRAILEKILPVSRTVRISEAIEKRGVDFFQAAVKNGLEGMVAKDLDSPYRSGARTREWLKIKTQKRQEAVICGFTAPRESRLHFGALILGAFREGRLAYIGHVGTGFTERSLKTIRAKLDPLVTARSPFPEEPRTNMPVTWVKPRLICEVKFAEWSAQGLMRQPVFLGLRDDKSPAEVKPEKVEPQRSGSPATKIRTRAELTHLDKVFWPHEGLTKKDLIEYYARMAEWILPYLKNRPQALNRHPDGITGEGFFQKNMGQTKLPAWVKTVNVPSQGEKKNIRYLVCQNRDTLLYEANLGCIEINAWSSSLPRLDSPDYLVLDFDPLETSFSAVIEAVLSAKELLDEMGIPAFCKTSGATGMHAYIPLAPRFNYDQVGKLAHLICLAINRRQPDLTSLERSPAKRKGRVYLDYLQNRSGATMAVAYALRPRDGAPVSMPLEWKEVKSGLDPLDFNIRTAPERVARKGDIWRDFFKKRLDLNEALRRFEGWRTNRKAR